MAGPGSSARLVVRLRVIVLRVLVCLGPVEGRQVEHVGQSGLLQDGRQRARLFPGRQHRAGPSEEASHPWDQGPRS